MRLRLISAPLLLCLGLAMACGGGGSSAPAPTGSLALRFGSDSFPGYSQAVVSLEKVEGSLDGATWIPLGSVKSTFDLMALQNGHSAVVLPATRVPAGTYTQFRLTWATTNYQSAAHLAAYVVTSGGVEQALAMPISGTTIISGSVTVPANGTTMAQAMLSGQQAVQARGGTTASFQATGRAYDLGTSATIAGRATSGTTPLVNAEVFAETVDGLGTASIQRRAFTDASGAFVLEALPAGSLYFVVSQPGGALSSYAAAATAPVNATTAATYMADLGFGAPQAPGALTLTLTPASTATQGTWGELRQAVATGSVGSQTLIVRSTTAATSPTQDQATFSGLAPGIYGVTAQRSAAGAAPVMKTGTQVLVNAGATATSTLGFP